MNEDGWIKATKTMAGDACVELRRVGDEIQVRDSKDPDGPVLRYTLAEIDAFIDGAKQGEFDHLTETL